MKILVDIKEPKRVDFILGLLQSFDYIQITKQTDDKNDTEKVVKPKVKVRKSILYQPIKSGVITYFIREKAS